MPVIVAEHAGYCMGVRRAVQAAEDAAKDGLQSCTLGDLIHNPAVVARLASLGLEKIERPSQAAGRRVIIRSHGVSPSVMREVGDNSSSILDLTCPFVERLHRCVSDGTEDGKPVILVGEKTHPEVIGTAGWAHGDVYFAASREDAEKLPTLDRALAVCQTTFSQDSWEEILSVLRSKVRDLVSRSTICSATEIRQNEAEELARRADAMIVVGGRNSANTRKLFEVCRRVCPRTILVERAAEISPAFADTHSELIGITAGASTPSDSLKEVVAYMNDIENQDRTNAAEEAPAKNDFMAEVDATLKKIRPGQTVIGKVVQVNDEEVCVNIGYKADGIIKRSDLVDQDAKVNDDIEVEVLKVNDGEGNVLLSQRNVVSRKVWDEIVAKYEAGEYVTGVGKQEVKGGLIADINGINAFIPASRLNSHYVGKVADYVGKELKLKIIEIDKAKKRIVASRKEILAEEAEAKKKAAYDRLEAGIIIHGIVRRLAEFGAFVDLGGIDGLIHITDLSWGHIKHPSEIVRPSQEVDVMILSVDPEKGRIQLGYKQLFPKPWDNASERYPEGALVKGKVVRLTTFGAFVELEPGLDGLVHISQCARTRIAKVEDAVKVGDEVLVKILGIDNERKRISLSIRQALEDQEQDEAEAAMAEYQAQNAKEAAQSEEPATEAAQSETSAEAAQPAEETPAEAAQPAEAAPAEAESEQ